MRAKDLEESEALRTCGLKWVDCGQLGPCRKGASAGNALQRPSVSCGCVDKFRAAKSDQTTLALCAGAMAQLTNETQRKTTG